MFPLGNIQKNTPGCDKAFMSTSSSFDVLKDAYIYSPQNSIILKVEGLALNVQSVSAVRGEKEYLVNRGNAFVVKSITKKDGFTEILLKDIGKEKR